MRQLRDHLNESIEGGVTGTGGHRRQHGQNDQHQHQNDTGGAERRGDRDQTVNKANGTQTLSKDAGGHQQHHHTGKRVSHAAIRRFQAIEHIFGVKAAAEFQNRRQQHAEHKNGDDVQLRAPFAVENQYADYRRKRQNGVESGGGRGYLVYIEHFMGDVFFFIQVALPEKVSNRHADNGHNRNGQRRFKSKVNQRHFGGFGGQHDIPGSGGENNRRRRSADSGGSAAADANVDHHREQRGHQQYSQTGRGGDGQRHQAGDKISGDHQ